MFSNIPVMKVLVLLCFIAATTAQPIFFGHGKQMQIFLTPRKDTITTTVNQIPTALVKPKPSVNVPVPVHPVQVPVQIPVQMQSLQSPVHHLK